MIDFDKVHITRIGAKTKLRHSQPVLLQLVPVQIGGFGR
jgi:hypothetical protein